MSLMYDADGNIIIDQMTDSPYAAALTAIRASWPEPENETELLCFRDKKGILHFFLAGGCTFWENGQIQARLYTFFKIWKIITTWPWTACTFCFCCVLCALCWLQAAAITWLQKTLSRWKFYLSASMKFAADASHELRTPLTVLSLGVESLQNDDESKIERLCAGGSARYAARKQKYMSRLIESVIDFGARRRRKIRRWPGQR